MFAGKKRRIKLNPLFLINEINLSFDGAEYIYKNGSCYQLYKILESVFPNAKPYYKDDHVVTKINGKYYDITGLVSDNYEPYDYKVHRCHISNFSLKDSFVECQYCGHPVVCDFK